jgi:hypothetical protein
MRPREEWIRDLVDDLRPVHRALTPATMAALWLLASWIFVVGATLATGSLRPGVGAQLASAPRFALECLLGLTAGALLIRASSRLSIPNPLGAARLAAPALAILMLWVGAYGVGLLWPALEPSMLGKRAHCYLQTLMYSGPPMLVALWLLRRAAPLDRRGAGALAGAAAGALPALMMQLACMYDPGHILGHHLAPIAATALLGAILGQALLRRI